MKLGKIVILIILTLLLIVVVLQNTQNIETKILFFTFQMPRALLLFMTTILGFLLGLTVSYWILNKNKGSRK